MVLAQAADRYVAWPHRQHHLRLLRYLHIDTAGVDLGPESGAA